MANQGQGRGGGKSEVEGRRTRAERGFAAMDPALQREIASEGGRAAHERGTAHEFTSEEAREAGRKGGMATAQGRARTGAAQQRGPAPEREGRPRGGTADSGGGHWPESTGSSPDQGDRDRNH